MSVSIGENCFQNVVHTFELVFSILLTSND